MKDVNIVCVAFLVSEEYDRLNGHQYDYDFGFLWIAGSAWIHKLKISVAEKYPDSKEIVYTAKLSGFKSFRIQSSHFRFRIQDLQRNDQTGCFRFGFVLLCVNGKTNPVLKRSGFITSPEQSPLV